MGMISAGKLFKKTLQDEQPLQIVGTINAYSAMQAKLAGFKAIYLSGAGVANASYGLPDLGITSLDNVLEDIRRVTSACDLPLLVDADTGFGGAFNIARTVKEMIKAGAAGFHLEDQVQAKRCGHRPNKMIVSQAEMVDRIKAAVDAKTDPDFVIMARTDAFAVEGMTSAIERALACVEAGADMIFIEALTTLSDYQQFTEAVQCPVLANVTEFGKTPLYTVEELKAVGIQLILYPLSAFRAMSQAAFCVYKAIREDGTQKNVIDLMQTRNKLYETLGYQAYEDTLDKLLGVLIEKGEIQ
jgi:methylisocitrate lyase